MRPRVQIPGPRPVSELRIGLLTGVGIEDAVIRIRLCVATGVFRVDAAQHWGHGTRFGLLARPPDTR